MEKHNWLLGHLISIVDYCDRNDLQEIEAVLANAMETIAPMLAIRRSASNGQSANVICLSATTPKIKATRAASSAQHFEPMPATR